jgi:hypothetical protein
MDNLLQPYLCTTSESGAEHRLKEFFSSVIEFFLHAGIFVQFSRLNIIEGSETIAYSYGSQGLHTLGSETL